VNIDAEHTDRPESSAEWSRSKANKQTHSPGWVVEGALPATDVSLLAAAAAAESAVSFCRRTTSVMLVRAEVTPTTLC